MPQAFFNRGNSFLSKLEFDKAIADYREAIRLDPDHDRAKANLDVALKARHEPNPQFVREPKKR